MRLQYPATLSASSVRTRSLGKTGLRVSELSLGTWGLSGDGYGPVAETEQERVLERALEIGLRTIETSDAYGAGRMEQIIGKALRRADLLDAAVVVTKGGTDRTTAPPRKRFDADHLRASVDRSLKRLDRKSIDVYLLHNPQADVFAGPAVETLLGLKEAGKIGHWGVSAGEFAVGRMALRKGAEVIELPYNLLHSTDLHRLGGEIMVSGAGVLARSTLAYGLLSGHWRADRDFPEGDHRGHRWSKPELARRLEQLSALRFLVRGDVTTLRGAAVRFVLANQMVASAVLGPRSVGQLEELVREVGGGPVYLHDAELARLPHVLDSVGVEI
jgi:aryl-alcohol dehydrogenase-like predicted oxidoreductase